MVFKFCVCIQYKPRVVVNTKRPFRLRIYASLCHNMLNAYGGNKEDLKSIIVNDHMQVNLQEEIGYVPGKPEEFDMALYARDKMVSGFFLVDYPMCENYLTFQPLNSTVIGAIHCVELIFR